MHKERERGGERAARSGGGEGGGAAPDDVSRRDVELTVYDKPHNEIRTFRCDRHLLETSMAYFKPSIQRYEQEEEAEEKKRLCSHDNGRDVVACTATSGNGGGATGVLTGGRVVNNAKGAVREGGGCSKLGRSGPLPPIPLRVNCDMNIFSWLMAYIEGKRRPLTPEIAVSIALSSNFLLMPDLTYSSLQYIKDNLVQVMLSGVNMECLTGELLARLSGMLSEGEVARAFSKLFELDAEGLSNRRFLTALLRHMVCDRFGRQQTSGLRWCRYCGVLFEQQELFRVGRSGKHLKPLLCPKIAENSIGSRGEVLTTHVASGHPVDLVFPSLSWSDENVERWAWRVIGAAYLFLCRHCNHLVSLIDTVTHRCHDGAASFLRLDDNNRADTEALLAWYTVLKDRYEGGLTPIYSHQSDVPRATFLKLSTSGEWNFEDGGESGVPGLWSSHPTAVERSVDARGEVDVDTQNGFERWFLLELQQMMEEFDESDRRPSACASDVPSPLFMTPPPPRHIASSQFSRLASHRGVECSGGTAASTRPPRCSVRGDGASPGRRGKTGVKLMHLKAATEGKRTSGALGHGGAFAPACSKTTRAGPMQVSGLSTRGLAQLGPTSGRHGDPILQTQR